MTKKRKAYEKIQRHHDKPICVEIEGRNASGKMTRFIREENKRRMLGAVNVEQNDVGHGGHAEAALRMSTSRM